MVEFSEQVKNMVNDTYIEDFASQKIVSTILVTYITMLREPDFSF